MYHRCAPSRSKSSFHLVEVRVHHLFNFFDVDGVTGVVVTQSPPIEEESSIFFIGKPLARSKTPRGLPKSKTSLLAWLSQHGNHQSSLSNGSTKLGFSSFAKTEFKQLSGKRFWLRELQSPSQRWVGWKCPKPIARRLQSPSQRCERVKLW